MISNGADVKAVIRDRAFYYRLENAQIDEEVT